MDIKGECSQIDRAGMVFKFSRFSEHQIRPAMKELCIALSDKDMSRVDVSDFFFDV